ncbi:MAG: DUF4440 domain-containing protein [Burkholderiales bacterium PBB3]|nr:MAG: DUF4440 domain-containing protein [Burkholderiales bacterium PBB3]
MAVGAVHLPLLDHVLEALLHPSFREFGRSGAHYTRQEIVDSVSTQDVTAVIWSQDFAVEALAENLALLTYRSARVNEQGQLERHTNRASLWQRTDGGWKMRFHQGTATSGFEKQADSLSKKKLLPHYPRPERPIWPSTPK